LPIRGNHQSVLETNMHCPAEHVPAISSPARPLVCHSALQEFLVIQSAFRFLLCQGSALPTSPVILSLTTPSLSTRRAIKQGSMSRCGSRPKTRSETPPILSSLMLFVNHKNGQIQHVRHFDLPVRIRCV
jgi:hypothetical protein